MRGKAVWLAAAVAVGVASAAEPPSAVGTDSTMGKPRHSGPGYLTWVGFEKRDGAARVFVRLSSAPPGNIGHARAGNEVIVTLPGYKLDAKNDGRPLDTRYFDTAVVRVVAVPVKHGVELRVRTKGEAAEPKISTGQSGEGEQMVYVDF